GPGAWGRSSMHAERTSGPPRRARVRAPIGSPPGQRVRIHRRVFVLLVCCFPLSDANASASGVRSATDGATTAVIARSASPIIIDGVLDEPDWKAATPIGEIRQREPHPGDKASESTEV